MLESIFIILLILAILFLLVSLAWESIVLSAIDMIMWFILAYSILYLEIPYQYSSGGTVTTAMHTVENLAPVAYLFMGIGIVMFIYMASMVLDSMQQGIKSM